jgi:purine-binding chemotaxis protein CheW
MNATQAVEVTSSSTTKTASAGQYLTFLLAGEEYGLDILKVQEIRGWLPVTRIPHTPPHVQGVLNLRGTIVPIIDLRQRFDMARAEYTHTTVVIVMSVADKTGKRAIGIVVDGVSDVLNITPEAIRPAPNFGTAVRTEFVNGLGAIGNRMVILLDSDKLLTEDELTVLDVVH